MAGNPAAFQPDAFQNNAFQTGEGVTAWSDDYQAVPSYRAHQSIQSNADPVNPSSLRAGVGWESILPPTFRSPLPRTANLDVLPNAISGRWGWNPEVPRPFRAPGPQAIPIDALPSLIPTIVVVSWGGESPTAPTFRPQQQVKNLDVLPSAVSGRWGWNSELPRSFRTPWPQAAPVEVFPNEIVAFDFGWEAIMPPPFRIPDPQSRNFDVLPNAVSGGWGWNSELPRSFRTPWPQAAPVEVFPNEIVAFDFGWEAIMPPPFRMPYPQSRNLDVLPNAVLGGWGWNPELPRPFSLPPPQAKNLDVLPGTNIGAWGWNPELPIFLQRSRLQPADSGVLLAPYPIGSGWEAIQPGPFRIPPAPAWNDDMVPLFECPVVYPIAEAHGSASQEFGDSIDLNFYTPIPAFLLIAITGEGGTPPLQVVSVGGDASSLAWRKLSGGQFDHSIFTVEYWGAFAPFAIASDQVTITFSGSAESSVSFIALGNVNPTPIGSSVGPGTVANNLFVTFNATSPRSMLFAASISEPDDAEPVAPGLNTTVYEQSQASQCVRSTNPTLGGMLTMSTNGYTHGSTLYYEGIEILSLPCHFQPWGWEPAQPSLPASLYRQPFLPDVQARIFTPVLIQAWEPNLVLPMQRRMIQTSRNPDILPALAISIIQPWGWDPEALRNPTILRGRETLDDWWPPFTVNRVMPGGGYKPWYGWEYPEIYEDDDLRERLERSLYEIDEQLAALAAEEEAEEAEEEAERQRSRAIVPELLPPGWQDDEQRGWESDASRRRAPRQDPYRHVHYNFASDLDFGVRRRIIGILDRAEHRKVNIFGSEAFRTRENALVRGRFVEQGTNAWVIRLDSRARLEIAREAVAEGFRLLSFDDTSLSFIHRPTFPWKPVLLGAGAGATIMGAGIFTGWLIWGRNPRK